MTDTPTAVAERPAEDKVLPIVVYALYLLSFTNGLTLFVGLIVAYLNRGEAGPVNASHYTFAIRTFWLSIWWFLIGVALILFGVALLVVLIGLPMIIVGAAILAAITLWFVVRMILGLNYLLKGEPYPRPQAWLF
ncbi:MAG: hypothetical protein J7521_00890 [Caulobacter sp.]|nr:hypothetical protein [Caulobacter sp.]